MFEQLEKINTPPKPFEFYTASDLWTDEYTSEQMLQFNLDEESNAASSNAAFIDQTVEWIASRFNIKAGTKIADFGCGPGLYATRLAQRHANVTGIDFSTKSVQYARQVAESKGLSIQYVSQNYLDFETDERFRLILMTRCNFCALSPTQRKKMLTKFHTFLEPNGSVLVDVYSLTAFEQREEKAIYETNLHDGFWSPNKYYVFLNSFKYEKEKVVLNKYAIIEAGRTRTVYNWSQCFSVETLGKEFGGCGLAVEGLYSDVSGSPFDPEGEEFAVVAKKL